MTRRSILLSLAAIALVVGACSGAASSAPVGENFGPADRLGLSSDGKAPVPAATAGPADASTVAGDEQLIVRTGSMSLVVKDVPAAVSAARTAIEGLGGRVSASQSYGDQDKPSASVTYRVPAARFNDALTALRALGLRVLTEQTQDVEVTGQVIDLAARLDNLRVTEKALQGIMDTATKIPDVLAVQSQLSDVRGQIEELTAQKAHLEDQAAMSTLSVDFTVDVPASQTAATGWDPGKVVDEATSQLIGLGQGLATLGIEAVIVGVPVALLLGFLGALAYGVLRLARRLRPRGPGTPTEA